MTHAPEIDCEVFRLCLLDAQGTFCAIQAVATRCLKTVSNSTVHFLPIIFTLPLLQSLAGKDEMTGAIL